MTYRVIKIEEDLNYGCEERREGSLVKALITLEGEDGPTKLLYPDQLLYQKGIKEGSLVEWDNRGGLELLPEQ